MLACALKYRMYSRNPPELPAWPEMSIISCLELDGGHFRIQMRKVGALWWAMAPESTGASLEQQVHSSVRIGSESVEASIPLLTVRVDRVLSWKARLIVVEEDWR